MKVAVSAKGTDIEAQASPVFGRCQAFVLVDSETMAFEALENPSISARGGAGVQAAQFVIDQGAEAVIAGNFGPNAFAVLNAAGVSVYRFDGGSVRQAVEACAAGKLVAEGGATVPDHTGLGQRRRQR
jgi:predicted Fe-Mo cluster-binding NifX family protein